MNRSLRIPNKTFALTLSSTTSLRDQKNLNRSAVAAEAEASVMGDITTETCKKSLAPIGPSMRMALRSKLTKRVSL